MRRQLIFIASFFLVFSTLARANIFIDEKVQNFIQSNLPLNKDSLRVLVVFKRADLGSVANGDRTATMQAMGLLRNQHKTLVAQFQSKFAWSADASVQPLWIVNGLFVTVTPAQAQELVRLRSLRGLYWAEQPLRIEKPQFRMTSAVSDLNRARLTWGVSKVGVGQVQAAFPQWNGAGVRVGVLDTGISANHPDLEGKLLQFKNFSPARETDPEDGFNHGTHVAGTIAGGSISGEQIGVAPGAGLVVARIFSSNGESTTAQILQAMQWVADPDEDPDTNDFAQVVNASWGSGNPYTTRNPEDVPFCQAIRTWADLGIIPVVSAGNTGPAAGSINIPGACPDSFTVGATEINDRSPIFSSVGPAQWKDFTLEKPDVVAPGMDIKSASANWGGYFEMSGTSMATPHVTGAFAILLQAFPDASPEELKAAMIGGAKDLGAGGYDPDFGNGRIDVMESLRILGAAAGSQQE